MELLNNPFATLGATTRDDKRRIMVLAEEKSLISDEAGVRDAVAVLTNPRRRIAAEVGWLSGLGPKRILEAISTLESEPAQVRALRRLPSLARANLLADGLIRVIEQLPQREVALWIIELADAHEEIEIEQTTMALNEERSVAGFPAISDMQSVEAELQNRRQFYKQAIIKALDKISPSSIVEAVTSAVDKSTGNGSHQAPILIDDLVDAVEVKAQELLKTEADNVSIIVHALRDSAELEEGRDKLNHWVTRLENVVRKWDRFAQPMQVSARSRGTSHNMSLEIHNKLRRLAVDLTNKHGLVDVSKRLTALQQEVFAEVDRVVEQLEEDASALDRLAGQRTQFLAEMEARADSWKREITYEVDIGLIFKNKLRISPEGVQWKGSNIPLEEIKRVRWGSTRHSVNGIPTGTTYKIFVGSERGGTTIELRKEHIYSEFVDRLWKTAGVRLLTEMLKGLCTGKRFGFGTAVVTDHGVELERRKLIMANERVPCKWTDLVIGNGSGTLRIAKNDEEKVAVELSYQEIDNVHILEAALYALRKSNCVKLSDLLDASD